MVTTNKGFTLVEMAIVLVIIGLLIGGILVAQSMTEAARINGQVQQIQQFDILMSQFKDKYGAIPGDSPLINGVGNKDGIIRTSETSHNILQVQSIFEWANVWSDLSTVGMQINGRSYAAIVACGGCALNTTNVPVSAMEPKAGVFAYGILSTARNYYSTAPFGVSKTNAVVTGSIKPATMLALDSKMDNGLPHNGRVIARAYWGTNIWDSGADPWGSSSGCVLVSGKHNVTSNSYACEPRIDMLSQTGEN